MIHFPFTAIVGQERLKLALILNAVAPEIGGVLIQGERGTAKSTAVRALAELLPEIPVVAGCPFGCDPRHPSSFCPHCASGGEKEVVWTRAPLVELPLGASEDRVLGHLDLEAALRQGAQRFTPGLLFQAHRGILYVDEVNLLPDHLVDVLLDVAASGWHVVEREGFSVRHPARFVLVGTMNPEEGELRPQLVDRFGLGVHVAAPRDPAVRALVVERRMQFDADPAGFAQTFAGQEADERRRIAAARQRLLDVAVPEEVLAEIATICSASGVAGLRADLVLYRAARALAAYRGRSVVSREDVWEVAELALLHRGGKLPEGDPPPPPPKPRASEVEDRGTGERPGNDQAGAASTSWPLEGGRPLPDRHTPLVEGVLRRRLMWQGRVEGRIGMGGGKHFRRRPSRRGPKVGAEPFRQGRADGEVAWRASLLATLARGRQAGGRPRLTWADLRRVCRRDRSRVLLVLLLDLSGSMGTYCRMLKTKAAVAQIVAQAYVARDRVAIIGVRGKGAELLLPPTNSVRRAKAVLAAATTGGRTPFAEGLRQVRRLVRQHSHRNPDHQPVLLVFSDGRVNAGGSGDPLGAALAEAALLRRSGLPTLFVAMGEGVDWSGRCRRLAAALAARVIPIEDLLADLAEEGMDEAAEG